METIMLIISLIALAVGFTMSALSKQESTPELNLDIVSTFIYDLDDPDVLKELSILTDVRRLLLHLELTEGIVRLG